VECKGKDNEIFILPTSYLQRPVVIIDRAFFCWLKIARSFFGIDSQE